MEKENDNSATPSIQQGKHDDISIICPKLMHMKPFYILFLVCLLFIPSCLDYEITTKLNRDGSLERELIIRGDSSDLTEEKILYPVDSSWQVQMVKDSISLDENNKNSKENWALHARRNFSDSRELNSFFDNEARFPNQQHMKVEVKKQFRWFYTFITYKEQFFPMFPFTEIPLNQSLKQEELDLIFAPETEVVVYNKELDKLVLVKKDSIKHPMVREDSLRAEELENGINHKFAEWQNQAVLNGFYTILKEYLIKQNNNLDTNSLLAAKKVIAAKINSLEILPLYNNSILTENKNESPYDYTKDADRYISTVLKDFSMELKDSMLQTLNTRDTSLFKPFKSKLALISFPIFEYVCKVEMPGLLMDTNGKTVEGNTVKWEIPDSAYYMGSEMEAQSRVVNRTSMVLTGVFFVLAVLGFIAGLVGRKH
jgi:hypothetical protein